MLKFALSSHDLSRQWHSYGSIWRSRQSWIEPYNHPFIETISTCSSEKTQLIVREVLPNTEETGHYSSAEHDMKNVNEQVQNEIWEEMLNWPLDWIAIQISTVGEVVLCNGLFNVAPVYLVQFKNTLRGSWDPIDLYPYLSSNPLNHERTAHYLVSFAHPYSKRTVFSDLYRLTERSYAEWKPQLKDGEQLSIIYPSPIQEPKVQRLRKNISPEQNFKKILRETIERRILNDKITFGFHLSGGLDSGIVSANGSMIILESIYTYGLCMPGSKGMVQRQQRKEFVNLFKFNDFPINADKYPPFVENFTRIEEDRMIPWEECYDEAFEQILKLASCNQNSALLMGTGGDELLYPHWEELSNGEKMLERNNAMISKGDLPNFINRKTYELYQDSFLELDRSPQSIIPVSALEDSSCSAPLTLRHGIWPIHPLCSLEIVAFCRSLPQNWRNNRRLFREVLASMRCSKRITHPHSKEDFTPIMSEGICRKSRKMIRKLFLDSILGDYGFVDGKRLVSEYDAHCTGDGYNKNTPFYAVAILELALRAHINRYTKDTLPFFKS